MRAKYSVVFSKCYYEDLHLLKLIYQQFYSESTPGNNIELELGKQTSLSGLPVSVIFPTIEECIKFYYFFVTWQRKDLNMFEAYDKDFDVLNSNLIVKWFKGECGGILINSLFFDNAMLASTYQDIANNLITSFDMDILYKYNTIKILFQ